MKKILLCLSALLAAAMVCGRACAQDFHPALMRNNRLFFLQDDLRLTVLDVADGRIIEQHSGLRLFSNRFIPVGDRDVAAVCDVTALNKTYLLDGVNGRVLWENGLKAVLAVGDTLVCVSTHDLIALDGRTGKEKWRRRLPATPDPLLVLDGKLITSCQLFGDFQHKLIAIDPDSGGILWAADAGRAAGAYFEVAYSAEGVFAFVTDYHEGERIVESVRAWSSAGEELASPSLPAGAPVRFTDAMRILGVKRVGNPDWEWQYPRMGRGGCRTPESWSRSAQPPIRRFAPGICPGAFCLPPRSIPPTHGMRRTIRTRSKQRKKSTIWPEVFPGAARPGT